MYNCGKRAETAVWATDPFGTSQAPWADFCVCTTETEVFILRLVII